MIIININNEINFHIRKNNINVIFFYYAVPFIKFFSK